jgi:2-C-methyl-D-erythritol 4-phosphate cytidylyltransferase/2-C-methyl-D-erythritol 2,4-cyclodiphosphate synthase
MSSAADLRRVWAIVPAAGRGERFDAATEAGAAAVSRNPRAASKQYSLLLGSTVLEWSLRRLLAEPRIKGVVVVLASGDAHWPAVAARWRDVRLQTAVGGASRRDSVLNGLAALENQAAPDDWVLVHDAARPCLSAQELSDLLDATGRGANGAVLAAPLVDTIKRGRDGLCVETVERRGLWRALTPQIFAYAELRRALTAASKAGVAVTDEAQAMERLGHTPQLVAGSPFNIKLTHREDLATAAGILKGLGANTMRIGQGFDAHAFGDGDHVMLGGVRIAHVRGVVAHSDGDVVIHALCDAVLGALGQGDIGQHFPDTDPAYRGADSRVFLREIAVRIDAAGLKLVNADITVLAEAPRIAAHRAAMAAALAADLGVAPALINIKATTTERMGFVGRGEGVAALASVLLDA